MVNQMPHYNSYDSFKTKKSIIKKQSVKNKVANTDKINEFIINEASDYGIVIDTKYNEASILYKNELVTAKIKRGINLVCNQTVFPGDKVVLDYSDGYNITNLIKRTSLLSRVKKDRTRLDDVGLNKNIAANIDLAIIVVSAQEPPLHPKFIDRYLMILSNSNIKSIICLNKSELKTKYEENILNLYKNIGIDVIETSTYNNKGIDELRKIIRGKQAILVGNSGVGKSSLINLIVNESIKTSQISDKSHRGKHTTTLSKYYLWDNDSSIIDTPGIRSLDVSTFSLNEIQDYFKEFNEFKNQCKYNDCIHYDEPTSDCMIKLKVEEGIINKGRYDSYIKIIKYILNDK